MFTWYRKSVVCYAYLEDLETTVVLEDLPTLGESRWFTRGWTLQELIAPGTLVFFGKDWAEIGSRDTFITEISKATGIDEDLFLHGKLSQYSVAQRMSWAAKRQTTRLEDEAYCLLGVFGVNMPLLYGEGKIAFIRLQEEIMRRSDDQSIFAWTANDTTSAGLLAPSPSCFSEAGQIVSAEDSTHQRPFFLTNKGIQISLPIQGWTSQSRPTPFEGPIPANDTPRIIITPPDTMIAILNCQSRSGKRVALAIDRTDKNKPFRRVNADMGLMYLNVADCQRYTELKTILVVSHGTLDGFSLWDGLKPTFFGIQGLPLSNQGFEIMRTFGYVAVDKAGMLSAQLSSGERVGIAFTDKRYAFGIFLAEGWKGSYWELVSGPNEEVGDLLQKFQHKDYTLLTSNPTCIVPFRGSSSFIEIHMETRRRPHGFSSIVKLENNIGKTMTEFDNHMQMNQSGQLKRMLVTQESIGVKVPKRHAGTLSTHFPRDRLPNADVA